MTEEECTSLARFGEMLKKACDDLAEAQLKINKVFGDILSLLEDDLAELKEQESVGEEHNNG